MKVDILIAGNPPKGTGGVGTVTKTLLQNVEVLSAGQNIQRDAEGKPVSVNVVNMLVTPEQAEILSLASNETRIQLVLRNPTDTEETETAGTAIQYLFDNNGKAPKGAPPAPVNTGAKRQVRTAATPPPPPPPPPAAKVEEKKPEPIKIVVFHGSSKKEATFELEEEKKAGSN
jgi:pilus assembly protein CpaB